jgi:phenylacetate-coenzyme A ligase PaaK-like adenylate-forming protein
MQGLDLASVADSVRVIFAGGAVLPPAMRRVIEKDWQARIVEIYGSNETMLLGVGCVEGKLHLCSDLLEIEVLDARTHAPVPPGERGLLTVTSLVHEVMPLVRYVTGDLVALSSQECPCGEPAPTAEVYGRQQEVVEIGGVQNTAYDILDAAYEFGDCLGTRIFFVLVRRRGLHLLVEVPHPESARDLAGERRLAERLGVTVTVEYLGHNEVMDRTAMFRGPKIYKPSQISDWRGSGRKTITIMEALLEWPRFDLRTLMHIGSRQWRNARRRRRILREEARS